MESFLGLLVALSIASERLVEILKGWLPSLNETKTDAQEESKRKAKLQILAVLSGVATAFMAQSAIASGLPAGLNTPLGLVVVGLMASGGSGFWNAILSYSLQVKDLKKLEVQKGKAAG